jgi:hypothetical protein
VGAKIFLKNFFSAFVIIKKLPKENHYSMGEKSANLVTLPRKGGVATRRREVELKFGQRSVQKTQGFILKRHCLRLFCRIEKKTFLNIC